MVEGRVKELKDATKIMENRFAKGTELYREFRLFNALAKTQASDTHIVASILSEAKIAARRTKIFIDKSKNHKPKAAEIRLTGNAIAGTITAFKFPKNK